MKNLFIALLQIGCLLMLTGCFQTSATIADYQELKKYNSFAFPVKFYIEKVTHIPAIEKITIPNKQPHIRHLRIFHRQEEERWREGLYKYWPELFSRDPENALSVCFSLEYRLQKQEERNGLGLLGAVLLSSFSYGVFPAVWNEKHSSVLLVEVEKQTKQASLLTIKSRTRGNNAIFGLWGTRYLIPKIKDTLFETEESLEAIDMINSRVREERLKDFLQLFVAELHRLPHDKIEELYLSRKTTKIKLLE